SNCLIAARTTREVSDEIYQLLQERRSLRLDRLGEPRVLEMEGRTITVQTMDLSDRELVWLTDPPAAVVSICADVRSELHAEAARLVGLTRWFFNRPFPARPLSKPRLTWSLDGSEWVEAPTRDVDLPMFEDNEVELSERGIEALGVVWQRGKTTEPL